MITGYLFRLHRYFNMSHEISEDEQIETVLECNSDKVASNLIIKKIKLNINAGSYKTKERGFGNSNNRLKSPVWSKFHEIFDANDKKIERFYYCIACSNVVWNPMGKGNTVYLLRHKCVQTNCISKYLPPCKRLKFDDNDKKSVYQASAKFVSLDLRPFRAIEGGGLNDLLVAAMQLGKKYPFMTEDDLKKIIPSSTTIRQIVKNNANSTRELIKISLRKVVETIGAIGCTVDLWTDDFAHLSYISVVVHFFETNGDTKIEYKKFIIYLNTIDAVSKTGEAIRAKITNVFNDYELSLDK